jgi:plasmid stability protein
VATIQVRDLPEDVAETFRRRANAAGMSLQSYMRDKLVADARRRDKAEVMDAVREVLDHDPGPGISDDTLYATRRELRGE